MQHRMQWLFICNIITVCMYRTAYVDYKAGRVCNVFSLCHMIDEIIICFEVRKSKPQNLLVPFDNIKASKMQPSKLQTLSLSHVVRVLCVCARAHVCVQHMCVCAHMCVCVHLCAL